jgi:hypothetical protein
MYHGPLPPISLCETDTLIRHTATFHFERMEEHNQACDEIKENNTKTQTKMPLSRYLEKPSADQ